MLIGCATTPTVPDVLRCDRQDDLECLRQNWHTARKDDVRIAVLEAFSKRPSATMGRQLVLDAAESERSPSVRAAALRALRKYDGPDVIDVLIRTLAHPWPESRELARSILTEKGTQAHPALLDAATADHPLTRAMTLKILTTGALTHPPIRPSVEDLLLNRAGADDASVVRDQAVQGIGRLKVERGRALLAQLARSDPDSAVRLAAGHAQNQLGAPPEAKRVIVAVLPLKDGSRGRDKASARLGRSIAEYVTARLSAARVCDVVDREKVSWALSELRKVGRAVYDGDAPNVPEIGKFKIANQLVYGSVQRDGRMYTLVLNRMDVATQTLVPGASATVRGRKRELDKLKVELTERFLAKFQ